MGEDLRRPGDSQRIERAADHGVQDDQRRRNPVCEFASHRTSPFKKNVE
jgi:hypothetical protein